MPSPPAHLLVSPSTWLSMLPRFLLFLLENSSVEVFTFSRMLIELESWPYMMPICLQTWPMSFSTLLVRVFRASVWLERMVRVMVSNLAARLSSISPPESSMSSETCEEHSRLVFLQIPDLRRNTHTTLSP